MELLQVGDSDKNNPIPLDKVEDWVREEWERSVAGLEPLQGGRHDMFKQVL